jgi:DnaJ-domain-containing protein 1
MPVHALGRRLPFDVPNVGGRPPAGPDPVAAAFEHLDLARGASPAEVKDAYRERVKSAHPDHGGSQAEFKRLQEAYAMAREHATESTTGRASSTPERATRRRTRDGAD